MAKAKTKKKAGSKEVKVDQRLSTERRNADRRVSQEPVADERRTAPRRKVQRRRQIDPTTCERDYSNDEIEFMRALDEYKRANGRMFPTCSEILEVVRGLGYQRIDPTEPVVAVVAEADSEFEQEFEDDQD